MAYVIYILLSPKIETSIHQCKISQHSNFKLLIYLMPIWASPKVTSQIPLNRITPYHTQCSKFAQVTFTPHINSCYEIIKAQLQFSSFGSLHHPPRNLFLTIQVLFSTYFYVYLVTLLTPDHPSKLSAPPEHLWSYLMFSSHDDNLPPNMSGSYFSIRYHTNTRPSCSQLPFWNTRCILPSPHPSIPDFSWWCCLPPAKLIFNNNLWVSWIILLKKSTNPVF